MDRNDFIFLQVHGSYLLEYGYNTYDEIMSMTVDEVDKRFKDVTKFC